MSEYSDPILSSDKYTEDAAAVTANTALEVVATRALSHNQQNGYKQHELAVALAQITRLKDQVYRHRIVYDALIDYVISLE